MSKRDLVYVLVKISGFSWIVLALFTSVARFTNHLSDFFDHRATYPPPTIGYVWMVTPVIEIILAILIIRSAGRFTGWLMCDDKT